LKDRRKMVRQFDINKVRQNLNAFNEIAFAYVFGSAKDGVIKEGSDIDIGIYVTKERNDLDLRLKILTALENAVSGFDNFDLVILNNASSVLAMEAIKGKLLFVRDEWLDTYSGFYSLTCRQFEDDIFWMKKQLEYRGYEVQWDN
jgi:predicted nucleotidyltransferase